MCRQTQKRVRPTAELGTAKWLLWKIPTRGKNSIQQVFTAPTQCKEEGQAESLGMTLSWRHCVADRGASRATGTDEGLREGAGARPGAEDRLALGSASALGGSELSSQLGPCPWQRTGESQTTRDTAQVEAG